MSRRSPSALPPQPEDPVPVEHDSSDRDGGALMVDEWTASLYFSSMSPPRLPSCSAWATMAFVGHLPPSSPRSPTGSMSIQLWESDDAQQLPQQMGPTANCSAAVLEAAPPGTSHGIRITVVCRITREEVLVSYHTGAFRSQTNEALLALSPTVRLVAVIRERAKCLKSRGLELHTKTGRSSLAMIERYDRTEKLAASIRKLAKTLKSRGLLIHLNTETGGMIESYGGMIESYDNDIELGDNDAEQTEMSRKRPRNGSPAWLHFTKVVSKDSGTVTAMCKHCNNALKCESRHGTSHLLRHIKNVHGISSSSEACKEPKWPSCSQKLQITGSAACAVIPTPLTENNGNEIKLQDKDFELGNTSRKHLKGTSRTKSDVWLHFTKLPSADLGVVTAECNYCKKTLKADSQNGTSHLRRHLNNVHQMDLSSMSAGKEPILN